MNMDHLKKDISALLEQYQLLIISWTLKNAEHPSEYSNKVREIVLGFDPKFVHFLQVSLDSKDSEEFSSEILALPCLSLYKDKVEIERFYGEQSMREIETTIKEYL
ncbi:MAG: hypothetical protein ACPGJV_04195 [Bacteriovoracaceae bacterium]